MLDTLRKRIASALLPAAVKKDGVNSFSVISTKPANIPVYSEMTVRKATREGYKISIYVYRCVRIIVQAASGIPWIVQDSKGETIENHDFTKVWAKPNPEFSGQDNMEFMIAHQLLCGNALIQPIIVGRTPREFWMVMPDLVQPIPSDVPGEWLKSWQVSTASGSQSEVPADRFVHFMQMDPGNPYWGIGPLMAAARTIDTDNEAQDYQKVSMQNRATPDGVFTHDAVMTPEQFDEARRQIRENFLARNRRREPWILAAGAKWNQMSMSPVEMDFIASRVSNKRDIAGAFGISPIFLGDLEQSSYDNMAQAKRSLYEEVVIPMLDDIKSTLNLRIAPMYGDIIINYDTSKVAALREDYGKKVDQARSLFGMGVPFVQINHRLEMGFEEFPGWNLGYLPMQLLPTSGSPAPVEEPEEEPEKEEPGKSIKALNLLTEEQKTAHWKRIDRRRLGWNNVVAKKMLPLYEAEAKAVVKAIKGQKPDKLLVAADKAIDDGRPEWEKVITAVCAALIEDFGNVIADDLGAEKSVNPAEAKWGFDPMSAASRAWIAKNGAKSIVTILATNLDDVKRVILAGVDDNLSNPQIAKNIKQFYTDRSPFKAMRIARTETSHAAGFGQREAAKQSGVAKTKTWISSRDNRVRDSHEAMEGETVAFDKPYSDGSMYPGEQDIMCRCAESYEAKAVSTADNISGDMTTDARKVEKVATPVFKDIAKANGGKMKGLKMAVKRQNSLSRKIVDVAADKGISIADAAKDITDSVRYTMIFSEGQFGKNVLSAQKALRAKGYTPVKAHNFFAEGGQYRGYNTVVRNKAGKAIEIQYHTADSHRIKELIHIDYEQYRAATTQAVRDNLDKKMMDAWKGFNNPEGHQLLSDIAR